MTEFEFELTESAVATQIDGKWDATMQLLRARYPSASDGILFCVFKLQQNPELTIRDFRDEATLHGLRLSGRSLHSAKVLLGMEKPATRRKKDDSQPAAPAVSPPIEDPRLGDSTETVEEQLMAAVQQIQESATADANRLRAAIREAVAVLQRALDGRG